MKVKVIIRNIALTLLAVLALHFSARYLGLVMSPKLEHGAGENTYTAKDLCSYFFSGEKRNSADSVFIGSSHVYCGIDVNIINKEYGESALMLATTAQTLDLSYYAAMTAIDLQHPKTIFLETYAVRLDSHKQNARSSRALLNDLPNWSRGKLLAARASGQPMYYYLYPITDLHSTWWKITAKDLLLPRLPEGEHYCFSHESVYPMDDWYPISDAAREPISDNALYWLDNIVELCKETGTELVLYTAPYPAPESEQAIYRSLSDYAEKNGIVYYNLLNAAEKIGIDFQSDFSDNNHLNRSGQVKLSRYMAENCMNSPDYYESSASIVIF